jgi:hypothetical protein
LTAAAVDANRAVEVDDCVEVVEVEPQQQIAQVVLTSVVAGGLSGG